MKSHKIPDSLTFSRIPSHINMVILFFSHYECTGDLFNLPEARLNHRLQSGMMALVYT